MQRYIVTYLTPLNRRGVIVINAKTKRRAQTVALAQLFKNGIFELLLVRELYNPIIDKRTVSTSYELSQYHNGIYKAQEDIDSIPQEVRNRIEQYYNTGF